MPVHARNFRYGSDGLPAATWSATDGAGRWVANASVARNTNTSHPSASDTTATVWPASAVSSQWASASHAWAAPALPTVSASTSSEPPAVPVETLPATCRTARLWGPATITPARSSAPTPAASSASL
ncbi:MAG: hypothetical protein R2699_03970 [Acidimicrobiales bacterium]